VCHIMDRNYLLSPIIAYHFEREKRARERAEGAEP